MSELATVLGDSPGIQAVRQTIGRILRRQGDAGRLPPILIQGETGTGKGLLARGIHDAGPRRGGPFVAVNCAAIPETLLEAELFGFERGAFTDARQAKPGLFQTAHRGTLFLDEIGLLPEPVQGKLLSVIEERAVRRLGSTRLEPVDVWILTASNEDLAALTRERRFREDLYHRLAVVTLSLPPLRERGPDVLLLAEHFLARACADYAIPPKRLDPAAREALLAHRWPGNIRELANVMERVALLAETIEVTGALLGLPAAPSGEEPAEREPRPDLGPGDDPIERMARERDRLLRALEATGWNISRAATRLGLPRNTIRYRIQKLGLRPGLSAPAPPLAARHQAPPHPATATQGPIAPPEVVLPPSAGIRWAERRLAVLRVALQAPPGRTEWVPDTTGALEAFVEKAQGFGGLIEELTPDGIVAVFGLEPVEDTARRAAHAAMAIRKIAERAWHDAPERATIAVGLHTGLFTVGQVGSIARIDPNARREAWALLGALTAGVGPGEVLVSAAAAPFLERRFELIPVGPRPGVTGTVYRLAGLGGAARLARFVGRQGDLELLRSRLASAQRGQGQVVGIGGEAGIGKSRLLVEFRQGLAEGAVTCLEGHCVSYGGTIPYLPLKEVLRRHCGVTDGDGHEVVVERVQSALRRLGMDPANGAPYLLHLLGLRGAAERLAALSPEAVKARLFEVLTQISLRASRERPLVVIVEDLHWIDAASEGYLGELVESLAGARILLLFTYRPGYRAPWMAKSYVTQMAVQPLAPEDSLSLVRSLLPTAPLPGAVVERIVDKAGGNPFFLEELVRAVGVSDEASPPAAVPDTVQEVLLARIDRLADEPRRLLHTAAVLGREVSRRLLDAVWEAPGALDPHLRELVRQEFLYERLMGDETVYAFKHALTREVARESLPIGRRQALHAAAGRALEALYADRLEEAYDRLAYHYSKAKQAEKAVVYLAGLAEKAARSYAHVEAVAALREALDHVPRLSEGEQDACRLDLVLRQAHSLSFLGRFDETLALLLGQRERVEQLQDPARAGPFHFWLSHTQSYLGNHEQATRSAERALEESRRCGDEATMGKTYVVLAQESYWAGHPLRGIAQGSRAVELLERAGERWWLGLAHWIVGINHIIIGAFRPALEAEARALAIGESLEDPRIQSYATWSTGWIHALTGAWEAGIEACQRGLGRSPDPVNTAVALGHLGYVYLEMGEPDQAVPRLEQAVQQMREFGFRRLLGRFTTFLGEAYLLAGQLDRARDLVTQGRESAAEDRYWYGLGWAQHALGRVALASGSFAEAETHFREALEAFDLVQARFMMARTHLSLAELARARGDRAAAGGSLREAHALFRVLDVARYVELAARMAKELDTSLSEEATGPHVAVVRRGEEELFRTLQEHLGALGLGDVIWDRRVGQRRRGRPSLGSERRREDRRRPVSPTWDRLGFLFSP